MVRWSPSSTANFLCCLACKTTTLFYRQTDFCWNHVWHAQFPSALCFLGTAKFLPSRAAPLGNRNTLIAPINSGTLLKLKLEKWTDQESLFIKIRLLRICCTLPVLFISKGNGVWEGFGGFFCANPSTDQYCFATFHVPGPQEVFSTTKRLQGSPVIWFLLLPTTNSYNSRPYFIFKQSCSL